MRPEKFGDWSQDPIPEKKDEMHWNQKVHYEDLLLYK